MTYEELRNRVKDIMTNAKFENCKDISITNTGKWCINQMIFPISSITGKKLPKPFFMDEYIKFIYKEETDRDGKLSSIILIHTETVDYDGMLIVPGVQIKLETPKMTPEEYHNATWEQREELHCTYSSGCDNRLSLKDSIGFVVHERTRELLKDIYDEVIINGRSTH